MQDRKDAGQEGYRTLRTGVIQVWCDVGKEL